MSKYKAKFIVDLHKNPASIESLTLSLECEDKELFNQYSSMLQSARLAIKDGGWKVSDLELISKEERIERIK